MQLVTSLNWKDVVDRTPPQPKCKKAIASQQDWGEALDYPVFYGRTEELNQLKKWILEERCRAIALLGQGGLGKSALAVKLAQQIKGEFEYIIWRSLRESPPLEKVLADLIKFLSNQQEIDLPSTVGEKITRLIHYLQSASCLIVLDNVESILQSGDRTGSYREEYEGYGQLLERVGESIYPNYASCLILTSREQPREIRRLAGKNLPVRTFKLQGLQKKDAQKILEAREIAGSEQELFDLIDHYQGNPKALQIVPEIVQTTAGGSITNFLARESTVFGNIEELLTEQFDRLSEIEKSLMYWLAINRESVLPSQLQEDIVPKLSEGTILEALDSLTRRSLIDSSTTDYTLHNVVMEYATNCFVSQIIQ